MEELSIGFIDGGVSGSDGVGLGGTGSGVYGGGTGGRGLSPKVSGKVVIKEREREGRRESKRKKRVM